MAKIAGVTTQKNAKGELIKITIDLKKHGEKLTPILQEMGLIEKSQFDKDCEGALTVEEFKEEMLTHVRGLWK
jgi:hypothetical protein